MMCTCSMMQLMIIMIQHSNWLIVAFYRLLSVLFLPILFCSFTIYIVPLSHLHFLWILWITLSIHHDLLFSYTIDVATSSSSSSYAINVAQYDVDGRSQWLAQCNDDMVSAYVWYRDTWRAQDNTFALSTYDHVNTYGWHHDRMATIQSWVQSYSINVNASISIYAQYDKQIISQ